MSLPDQTALPDMLVGATTPARDFGAPLTDRALRDARTELAGIVAEARARFIDTFGPLPDNPREVARRLEATCAEMWREGWEPQSSDLDLFATDFGVILMDAMYQDLSGEIVLRSSDELSHGSLFWPSAGIEAFPLHKVAKRLLNSDGEGLAYFYEQVASRVAASRS